MKLTGFLVAVLLLAGPARGRADQLDDTYQQLKTAVASKDVAQVKKLVSELYPLTCEITMSQAPQDPDEKQSWTNRVEYAKGIATYAEYALFATAIQSPAPVMIDLLSTLEQQNAKSKYLDEAYGRYLVALNQTGAAAKIPAIADKAIQNFPENEDLLLYLADSASTHKQPDRALNYANRLVAALGKRSKPDSMSAADWDRKKSAALGRGYWIAGVISGERGQYSAADKDLRAALPHIQGNSAMLGPAYFYLGMANYQLGKMTLNKNLLQEAAKFSELSAGIASAYTEQARHNALVMKAEADKMR